jgi:hypothetical protein
VHQPPTPFGEKVNAYLCNLKRNGLSQDILEKSKVWKIAELYEEGKADLSPNGIYNLLLS